MTVQIIVEMTNAIVAKRSILVQMIVGVRHVHVGMVIVMAVVARMTLTVIITVKRTAHK
jgi:hypothetical protein